MISLSREPLGMKPAVVKLLEPLLPGIPCITRCASPSVNQAWRDTVWCWDAHSQDFLSLHLFIFSGHVLRNCRALSGMGHMQRDGTEGTQISGSPLVQLHCPFPHSVLVSSGWRQCYIVGPSSDLSTWFSCLAVGRNHVGELVKNTDS